MKQGLVERRQFLKKIGLGAAGVTTAAVMTESLSQIKQSGAAAKEEMRGMFVLLGIDVLLLI